MLEEQAKTEKAESYIQNMDFMHEYQGNFPVLDELPTIRPVVQWTSQKVSISVFGKNKNWKGDFRNNPELFPTLHRRNVKKVFIPNISAFTGVLAGCENFNKESEIEGIEILSGVDAEGLIIPSGSAGFFCTADCPTIIYHDIENDILIAAHAGLASVIDKTRILTGEPSRPYASVVCDIMEKVDSMDHYEIFVMCGIKYSSFSYDIYDPTFGRSNKKILNHILNVYGTDAVPCGVKNGNISILGIIRKQFSNYGINPDKIMSDGFNTYSDSNLWSHYLFSQMGRANECGRNGVLVIHSE